MNNFKYKAYRIKQEELQRNSYYDNFIGKSPEGLTNHEVENLVKNGYKTVNGKISK
jgi:hypothetical protein